MSKAITALLLVAALGLAGCLSAGTAVEPAASAVADDMGHDMLAMLGGAVPGLNITAEGCKAAGAVAQNPFPPGLSSHEIGVPHPFEADDTGEYLGYTPNTNGLLVGNMHLAYECEMWAINGHHRHMVSGGFIGLAVKSPPFAGIEPAARNFLVSNIATRDRNLTETIENAGFFTYEAFGHVEGGDFLDGSWGVTAIVDTEGDGVYRSDMQLKPVESWDLMRLWLILARPDGELHPAYIDVQIEGGKTYMGPGMFTHSGTWKHGPQGRADAVTGGLGFRDATFRMNLTVLPDTVEAMWMH